MGFVPPALLRVANVGVLWRVFGAVVSVAASWLTVAVANWRSGWSEESDPNVLRVYSGVPLRSSTSQFF